MVFRRYIALSILFLITTSLIFTIYAYIKNNTSSKFYVTAYPVSKYAKVLQQELIVQNATPIEVIYQECKGHECTFYLETRNYNMSLLLMEVYYENENLTNIFTIIKPPGEFSQLGNDIYIAAGRSFSKCYGNSLEEKVEEIFGMKINVTKYIDNYYYKMCVDEDRICRKDDAVCYIKHYKKYRWNFVAIIFPYIQEYKQYVLKVIY